MNKNISVLVYVLILINVLAVCLSGLVFLAFLVGWSLQDGGYDYDTSPQRIFVEAFGEDKKELIQECLRKHRKSPPFGESVYVNSITMSADMTINGFLGIVNCCLSIYLLLLLHRDEKTHFKENDVR